MADEDFSLSPTTSASAPSPSAHFYPFATSPDIIRSHEKDLFLTSSLVNQAQNIVRSLRGARFAHTYSDTIKNLTEVLYFSLTTLIGNRTLGEEYCDLVQLEDDTLQLPAFIRRAGYIVCSIIVPWILQRILPAFRQRLRAKLERSIARRQQQAQQARDATKGTRSDASKSHSFFTKLRIQKYILEHLDSITSLSPVYALSIATFYFTSSYYHLSKRFWGLRYVFTKKLNENEQRVGYEVLGVLLVLQITVQSILHVKKVGLSLQQEEDLETEATHSRGKDDTMIHSIENPSTLPLLPATDARYDLAEDSSAIPWIPSGQQNWVREKAECPLCRQDVLLSKVLPLRG
ncbi:peroxisome biogenesis factor 10 [Aspergillus hancockii]|nr:peroxisome biogenesis factor 10 [Aspergillus hancockii]